MSAEGCAITRSLFSLPYGKVVKLQCRLLEKGPVVSSMMGEQAEICQSQPQHSPSLLLFLLLSSRDVLLSFKSKTLLPFTNCVKTFSEILLKLQKSEMLQCCVGQRKSCTYTQLSWVHFPWPLHMSIQPSPMQTLSIAQVCCLSKGAGWCQRKRVA